MIACTNSRRYMLYIIETMRLNVHHLGTCCTPLRYTVQFNNVIDPGGQGRQYSASKVTGVNRRGTRGTSPPFFCWYRNNDFNSHFQEDLKKREFIPRKGHKIPRFHITVLKKIWLALRTRMISKKEKEAPNSMFSGYYLIILLVRISRSHDSIF